MRQLTLAFIALMFSASVTAGNMVGQTGPNVECELADGNVKYIPVMICKAQGGIAH